MRMKALKKVQMLVYAEVSGKMCGVREADLNFYAQTFETAQLEPLCGRISVEKKK